MNIKLDLQTAIQNIVEEFKTNKTHIKFHDSFQKLKNLFTENYSHDWKFNSFHWAIDSRNIIHNILYGFVQMKARADIYKVYRNKGDSPSNSHIQIGFYAESAIINLHSCRDKIALMIWSYLHPFNPENKNEVLNFNDVRKRLKNPQHFGFDFSNQSILTESLNLISNSTNDFKRLEDFRHYKIHRWEPRIEIFGKQKHHGWPYITFDYDNNKSTEAIKVSKVLNDSLWDYNDIELILERCIDRTLKSLTNCFMFFSDNQPFDGS